MEYIENIKYFFKVIFTPSCWIQYYPYFDGLDKEINKLLKEIKFEPFDYSGHVKLGDLVLWIKNYPYAAFTITLMDSTRVRPSRRTILKSFDIMCKDIFHKD